MTRHFSVNANVWHKPRVVRDIHHSFIIPASHRPPPGGRNTPIFENERWENGMSWWSEVGTRSRSSTFAFATRNVPVFLFVCVIYIYNLSYEATQFFKRTHTKIIKDSTGRFEETRISSNHFGSWFCWTALLVQTSSREKGRNLSRFRCIYSTVSFRIQFTQRSSELDQRSNRIKMTRSSSNMKRCLEIMTWRHIYSFRMFR